MREILFRTWDEKKKKLIYFPCRLKMEGYEEALIFEDYKHGYVDDDTETDDRELEQFTGLLDKNGKEIYEGDILVYNKKHAKCISFLEKHVVEKIYGCTAVIPVSELNRSEELKTDRILINPHRMSTWFAGQVIGNIYENPELIGDAK